MFTIISNILACLLWGAFISIVLVLFLYFIIRIFYPSYLTSIFSWFTLFILLGLLFIQNVMLVGAIYTKGYINDINILITNLLEQPDDISQSIATQYSKAQIKQEISKQYPMAEFYLTCFDNIDLTQLRSKMTAADMIKEMRSITNDYIFHRIIWIIGLIVVEAMILGSCKPKAPHFTPTSSKLNL